jgi:hypothetical protein
LQDWRADARIQGSRNLRGTAVKDIHTRSVRKFEAEDYAHGHLVEQLLADPEASSLLEFHRFL